VSIFELFLQFQARFILDRVIYVRIDAHSLFPACPGLYLALYRLLPRSEVVFLGKASLTAIPPPTPPIGCCETMPPSFNYPAASLGGVFAGSS
jgi:hypothetical protein